MEAPLELDAPLKALLAELKAAGLDLDATDGAWDEALAKSKGASRLVKQSNPEAVRRLRSHFRARWMRQLGLDPKKCVALEATYGPLEWRGCDMLSLYWAVEGVRAAETLGPRRRAKEERRLERLAINSVKHAVRRGRVVLLPDGEVFFAPEPRLVERLVKLYDEAIARARAAEQAGEVIQVEDDDDDGHHHEKAPSADASAGLYRNSLQDSRKDFLVEGVAILSRCGYEPAARKYFAVLKRDHPGAVEGTYEEFVNWILEQEAIREFGNQVTTYQILLGCWTRAWLALARGEDAEALSRIALADRVHREWKKKVLKAKAEGDEGAEKRLGTVDLKKVKEQSLLDARTRLANKPGLLKRLEERAGSLLAPKEKDGDK